MNQKLCKKLRRQARRMATYFGQPLGWNRRGQLINHPQSFRGIYLRLKHDAKTPSNHAR